MKAKMPSRPVLTVGMIVKNEEKHLENCLKALQPLREAIPCEVIVADTGSTDRTVEIAEKYADDVCHFEWCDDFATARNFVLDRSHGEWYFSLDADEYLDSNISDLIAFLSTKEHKKYNAASILLGSMNDVNVVTSVFNAIRLFRPSSGDRYVGAIHESVVAREPIRFLETKINHYGYAFQNEEEIEEKRQRNLKLINEALEKDPDNVRSLVEAAEGCFGDKMDLEYLQRGIVIARKNINHPMSQRCFYLMARTYYRENMRDEALDIILEFRELCKKETVLFVDIYWLQTVIYVEKSMPKEAVETFLKYSRMYWSIRNKEIDQKVLVFSVIEHTSPLSFIRTFIAMLEIAYKIEDLDSTLAILKSADLENMDVQGFANLMQTLLFIEKQTKDYSGLSKYYAFVLDAEQSDDENQKEKPGLFRRILEYYYLRNQGERASIAAELGQHEEWKHDVLIGLMKLEVEQEEPNFTQDLKAYLASLKNWNSVWAETYYLAMKHKVLLPEAALLQNKQQLDTLLGNLAYAHETFPQVALEYHHAFETGETLRRLEFSIIALEKAVLAVNDLQLVETDSVSCETMVDNKLDENYMTARLVTIAEKKADTTRLTVIDALCDCVERYNQSVYHPDIFKGEDLSILPPLNQFGYYYTQARICLKNGDELGYVRKLSEVLRVCSHMRELVEVVQFVLKEHKRQEDERKNKMNMLASQIKRKAEQLVQLDFLEEAEQVLKQYLLLFPNDLEAQAWAKLTEEKKQRSPKIYSPPVS